MKPVVLIMLAAGTWLMYSAIANKQPLGVLANAVGYTSTNPSVTLSNTGVQSTPTLSTSQASAQAAQLGIPGPSSAQQQALNTLLSGQSVNPYGANYNGPPPTVLKN